MHINISLCIDLVLGSFTAIFGRGRRNSPNRDLATGRQVRKVAALASRAVILKERAAFMSIFSRLAGEGPRRILLCATITLAVALGGCASTSQDAPAPGGIPEDRDPLEPVNRFFFDFSMMLDGLVLKPWTEIYVAVMPEFLRDGVGNVLETMDSPVVFANNLFQLDFEGAGNTLARTAINLTVGVGGFFDPATGWGFPSKETDFGETLRGYGVGEGPYLFLPLLGPNTTRSAVGLLPDTAIDPFSFIFGNNSLRFAASRRAADALTFRSETLGSMDRIERTSVDFYATVRSLYLQNQRGDDPAGRTSIDALPDLGDLDSIFEDEEEPEATDDDAASAE